MTPDTHDIPGTNDTHDASGDFALSLSCGELRCRLTGGPRRETLLTVEHRGRAVLADIVLGLRVDGERLGFDSELIDSTRATVSESYEMRTGKASGPHQVSHEQLTVTLRSGSAGTRWELSLRAAPDGAAFRYRIPAGARPVSFEGERTAIALPAAARVWPLRYQTWYETPRFGAAVRELDDGEYGFPFLLRDPAGRYALLSESGIDGRFSGAHLSFAKGAGSGDGDGDGDGDGGTLTLANADPSTELAAGTELPWRAIIVGTAADVVASSLIDDLAPAADQALADAPWIRPGRAAWSWWSNTDSPEDFELQKRYVDYAAARGWEHVLVDAGWNADWVPALVSHASARGVGIFLWSHWVDLQQPEAVEKLAIWKSWGIAGVKVDFMESESRERYLWYDFIIAEAARRELMLNFHGSVIPRGWARTYPHVMSYEAIRGAEYYIIDQPPAPTAAHNVIQPFTRNVVGSMDYTPVIFSAIGRETSDGHELALAIAFESGIAHYADDIAEYASRPLAEALLSQLPPSWQETRLLSGTPDTEAVVGRRHGDAWYVGCIATGPARTIGIELGQLHDGGCEVWVVADAGDGRGLVERRWNGASGRIEVEIAENGGFAAVITPGRR
jgi:hypothetical protein